MFIEFYKHVFLSLMALRLCQHGTVQANNTCYENTAFPSDNDMQQFVRSFKEYTTSLRIYIILPDDECVRFTRPLFKMFVMNVIFMEELKSKSKHFYESISTEFATVFIIGNLNALTEFANLAQRKRLFETRSTFCFVTKNYEDLRIIRRQVDVTAQERVFIVHKPKKKLTPQYSVVVSELFHNYYEARTDSQIIGRWNFDSTLSMKKSIEDCCHNISGATIRIVTVEHEPFVKIESRKPKLVVSGVCIEMMNALKKAAGFKYVVHEAPDNKFGRYEAGHWTGMIGELIEKKADIAMATFTQNIERMMVVDFSPPFVEGYLSIFHRKTKLAPDSLKNYVTTFSVNFWLLIIFSSLVLGSIWAAFEFTFVHDRWKNIVAFLPQPVFYMMRALAQQGPTTLPRRASVRVIIFVFYLFALFVVTCYTSVLVSFLTVTNEELPFKNIDELIKHPDYKPIFVTGTIDPESAKAASSLSDAEWTNILSDENNYASDYKDGVLRALNEPVGFVTFSHLIVSPKNVSTNIVVDKGITDTNGMAFPKKSPIYYPVMRMFMELAERGVLNRILSKYLKSSDLKKHSTTAVQVVDLQHSWFVFVIICIGMSLGILILFIEKLFKLFVRFKIVRIMSGNSNM
ncbi:Uncharacterised protein r2_g986 [Pycnogonum litorale]